MQLPSRIGKYELQEYLGGGMSKVYRAQDTVLGRTVAIKILTEAGAADAEAKARFLQEARMAGSIVHDNIISVYDFGEEAGKPFIVMEFLRGESLRDAIRNAHTGDIRNRLILAAQIARAIDYIHHKKIIHRDIKPENLQVDQSGKIKLMDFGIAKAEGLSLTRAGFTLGTPYYMAPEQVLGQQVTHLVDVYAFGILLFELLSGLKPISGESVEKIFNAILYEPLNLEPLRQGGVQQPVLDVVVRCTAKNPAERFQSLAEVAGILDRLAEGIGGPQPIKPGLPPPPKTVPPVVHTPPPPRPRVAPNVAAASTATDPSLPAFINVLPPALRSQQVLMVLVALAVLLVMFAVYLILNALKLI